MKPVDIEELVFKQDACEHKALRASPPQGACLFGGATNRN
jgi:hypothetical protein